MYTGGGENYAKSLLAGIKDDYDVIFITSYGALLDKREHISLKGKLFELLSWIIAPECDIIVGATYDALIPSLLLGALERTPVILMIYDLITLFEHGGYAFSRLNLASKITNLFREQIALRLLARLNHYVIAITLNPQITKLAREFLGVPSIVIPPGVVLCDKPALPTDSRNRDIDVVFVGRLERHKGVDILLKALRIAREKGYMLKTVIVGFGPESKKLVTQARYLGIDDIVDFTGRVSETEKYNILSRSKVFANFSLMEGFGIAMVEAMCMGVIPVVRNREYPEKWIVGSTGVYCEDPCNPSQAANALIKAVSISNPKISEKVRARASLFKL